MADEQIVTNIVANADFSGLITDLARVTASLNNLQNQASSTNKALSNQIAVMNRQFGDTLRSTGQFTTHFVTIGSDVDKFGKNLDAGRGKLRDFYGAWQQHHKQAGGLVRDLAKQQVQLQNSILQPLGRNADGMMRFAVQVPRGLDEVKSKTAIARQELQIMNKVVQEGANQLINWGKNTQWAGRQLTVGLTVPIAAFGKAAADAFRQADEELTRLTKVYGDVAGTSAVELGKVRKEVAATAKDLASSMGASFKDTLALSADIAATGKTGDELLGSIRETTRLSILGEVDRQDAMKATLAIQSAFKQNTTELADSINFLNAVENQTSTSLGDLVEAIPKAGPVIKGLGGSVQDLALYLTAMREGGINATEGANALKSGLASLINPTNVAVQQFKGFGIDILGIVNNNAGNVTQTLLDLQKALDTLDPLSKQQAIEQLFGKFQFARMNALFENLGKQGSQTMKVLDLMKASTGELSDLAGRELSQVTESASGKYRRALAELKADLATVGEKFLTINTYLIKFVDKIVDFANNLPGPIKAILGFLGGITAVAGPLIMLTGVLGNFFGYVIKGVSHFKALFKGGEGWKLLTPDILAANRAGDIVEQTFYSDAKAAAVLNQALRDLTAQYDALAIRAQSGSISVTPVLNNISSQAQAQGLSRVVDKNHPLVGEYGTRSSGHMVPRKIDQPRTIFGLVPTSTPVNAAIGENPMMYSNGDLPNISGITSIPGSRTINGVKQNVNVSTGIVASEAAKHHAYTAALAMQSQNELKDLKKTIATTGAVSREFMDTFDDILPITTRITSNAAAQSASIVAELQQGKITATAAKERIIALNLAIERELGAATSLYAANAGRSINLLNVPGSNQPVQGPTGKSNMREMFKSRTGGIFSKIAESVGVRTSGAGYNVETTKPRRFAMGGVGVQKFANGYVGIRAAMKAAKMLREFSKQSSMVGGIRKPNSRSNRVGGEAGVGNNFGSIYRRKSSFWNDPENTAYGISATTGDDRLVHGMTPAFRKRTAGLQSQGSSVVVPRSKYGDFNLEMDARTLANNESLQLLPSQFIKNTGAFNTALAKGAAKAADFRPVTGSDMVSLLMFLKSQGLKPHQAKLIADRAAQVLNRKISSYTGPITEDVFGRLLNNASVRAIQSGAKPGMVSKKNVFGSDAHFRNAGASAIGLKEDADFGMPGFAGGVTKLPGYGGGDIIPALLEPGESVVTKTGTAGNEGALALMNKGYSIDRIMGFKRGVVGAGRNPGKSGNVSAGPGTSAGNADRGLWYQQNFAFPAMQTPDIYGGLVRELKTSAINTQARVAAIGKASSVALQNSQAKIASSITMLGAKVSTASTGFAASMKSAAMSVDMQMKSVRAQGGVMSSMNKSGWWPNQLTPGKGGPSKFGTGMGTGIAGSMAGGAIGQKLGGNTGMMIGSIAGNFLPNLISKFGGFAGMLSKIGPMALRIGGFLKNWSIPGAILTVVGFFAKKAWDAHKAAEALGKANRLAFGGTKDSFASVGIKGYKSLSDRLKDVNKQLELHKAQMLSTYNSYTKNGPTGVTLTITQLDKAIKNAKNNQKEYVEGFNSIDSSRVKDYATSLKAQFIGMGMSASDAANQIYAIIKASNKAGQAIGAVSSESFRAIQKNTDGIKFMAIALRKELNSSSFNAEEFATGLDTLMNALMMYQSSITGTVDKTGELTGTIGATVDEADALAATLKQVTEIQGTNKDMTSEQLSNLKDQNLAYGAILGNAESLQSATAKILMYQAGLGEIVNLASMGKQEAINFANNLSVVQNALNSITESKTDSNPLKGLAVIIDRVTAEQTKATAAAKKAKQADEEAYKAKFKLIDKTIAKIKDEAAARIKLLEIEQESSDYKDELRKAKLAYEQALASGDMVQAAEAQANLSKLMQDRQRAITIQNIQDRADADVKKKEKERQDLQDEMDALNSKYNKIQANAATKTAELSQLTYYRDQLEEISLRARANNGALTKDDKIAVANIIQEMKNAGGELKKEAERLVSENPGGTVKGTNGKDVKLGFEQGIIDSLNKALSNTGNTLFNNAVDKFDLAVQKFAGKTDVTKAPVTLTTGSYSTASGSTSVTYATKSSFKSAGVSTKVGTVFNDSTGAEYKVSQVVGETVYATSTKAPKTPKTFTPTKIPVVTFGHGQYSSSYVKPSDLKAGKVKSTKGSTFVDNQGKKWEITSAVDTGGSGYPVKQVLEYRDGGPVFGSGTATSDSIPAMLSNGEYVINAKAVQSVGMPMLDKINKMALGGMVTSPYGQQVSDMLKSGSSINSSAYNTSSGNVITIAPVINAAPGMDERMVADLAARQVMKALDQNNMVSGMRVGTTKIVTSRQV